MKRSPHSHKGENGKVAIIGGSKFQHGAPLLSALAAEASGVDLVFVCLPSHHADTAKSASLNFQVHPFHGDDFTSADIDSVLELLATMDSAVIGPGIARSEESISALHSLIDGATCPMVLDATALQPWTLDAVRSKIAVLTPHQGELERMNITSDTGDNVVLLKKGEEDEIISATQSETVTGGNAGLTVGGTGDTLAGIIGGLIAQGMQPFDASVTAARIVKRAATTLFADFGYAFTAEDVIGQIPTLLHQLNENDDNVK